VKRRPFAAIVALTALATPPAWAQPLGARDTARVGSVGSGSAGLFAPVRFAPREGLEIETHPLVFFVSPNATARVRFVERRGFRLTGEYGVSVPTLAMRLTQGVLFPSWETSGSRIGWFVVPSAGVVLSTGEARILSVRVDTALGIPLGRNDAEPLDTYAPLELLFAPALRGFRTHAGVSYDAPLVDGLRARFELDVYYVGRAPAPTPSPVFMAAEVGVDVRLTTSTRLVLGVRAYDYDQRRTHVVVDPERGATRTRRRSLDVLPLVDLRWAW